MFIGLRRNIARPIIVFFITAAQNFFAKSVKDLGLLLLLFLLCHLPFFLLVIFGSSANTDLRLTEPLKHLLDHAFPRFLFLFLIGHLLHARLKSAFLLVF